MEQQTNVTLLEESTVNGLDSFKTLFKQSWNFFVKHFLTISSFLFLLAFVPSLLNIFIKLLGFKVLPGIEQKALFILFSVVLSLFGMFVGLLFQFLKLGAIKKVQDVSNGIEESHVISSKKILKSAIPLFLVWVVGIVATLGGSFLLIVPGVMVALSLLFATPFVVLEKKQTIDALVSSFWLVNGKRAQVFGRYALLMLVLLGVAAVVLFVLGTIAIVLTHFFYGGVDRGIAFVTSIILSEATAHTVSYYLFMLIWSLIVSLVLAPFWALFTIFNFFVFQNLKTIVTTEASERFKQKTKRTLQVFSFVAVLGIVLSIVLGILFEDRVSYEDRSATMFNKDQMLSR